MHPSLLVAFEATSFLFFFYLCVLLSDANRSLPRSVEHALAPIGQTERRRVLIMADRKKEAELGKFTLTSCWLQIVFFFKYTLRFI